MTKPDSPELIELIDQIEKLLNESELSEIEIEAGQTGLVLRKPSALANARRIGCTGRSRSRRRNDSVHI